MHQLEGEKNTILSLEIEGIQVTDIDTIKNHVTDFYKTLLGTTVDRDIQLQEGLWGDHEKLSLIQQQDLENFLFMDEIKKKLFLLVILQKHLDLMDFRLPSIK